MNAKLIEEILNVMCDVAERTEMTGKEIALYCTAIGIINRIGENLQNKEKDSSILRGGS